MKLNQKWIVGFLTCVLMANLFLGTSTVLFADSESSSSTTTTATTPGYTTTAPTTTTVVDQESSKKSSHWGVLGGLFHVIGEVIAFPFRLVAETIRFIF